MFKKLRDKIALSGITVLTIGVALLIFTFISAYGFLTQAVSILGSADISKAFGEAIPSLITATIHSLYLGILIWIGSLLTTRGITIIQHLPETSAPITEKPETEQQHAVQKTETQKQPQPTEPPRQEPAKQEPTKQEPIEQQPKTSEPQIMLIPPEKTHEIATPQTPSEKKETQANS